MKLEEVSIRGFRSISNTSLKELGGFNVLIGKNNTGKSNLLSAIHMFFRIMADGDIITLDPPIGKRLDFHGAERAINLTLKFLLTSEERAAIIRDISTEAQQMKNAAEALPQTLRLKVGLTAQRQPKHLAYLNELTLEDAARAGQAETVLLKVSCETASELAQRQEGLNVSGKTITALKSVLERFGEEQWDTYRNEIAGRARTERASQYPPLRYMLRHWMGEPWHDVEPTVIEYLREEKTYQGFRRAIESVIQTQEDERQGKWREPLKAPYTTYSGSDAQLPNYAAAIAKRIGKTKVHYLTERRKQIGKQEAQRLLNLKVKRGGSEELRNIQEAVNALLGVHIDAYQGEAKEGGENAAELDVDNFLVEANGSGIKEALRLILDIEFSHPAIVLVEEPETHLHPALETSLMRYLKRTSEDCQVFITTHSTNFLDTADMGNVYLVSKKDDTVVQKVGFDEAEEHIPSELGLKLSSFFMFDRLVFVEGVTDENIIREWASKLGHNIGQTNVGFINIGGSRNFHYFATDATLSFLRRRGVAMWFIIDRDERDDADITKLTEGLGGKAEMVVLQRRELENYLLCERPLSEFVSVKRRLMTPPPAGDDPDEGAIRTALDECAGQLKELAIQKRLARKIGKPYFSRFNPDPACADEAAYVTQAQQVVEKLIASLTDVKGKMGEIAKQERASINADWARKKLDLIPGDELLDAVCRKFGVRFIKEKDTSRLAALFKPEEIPGEFKNVIEKLVAQ